MQTVEIHVPRNPLGPGLGVSSVYEVWYQPPRWYFAIWSQSPRFGSRCFVFRLSDAVAQYPGAARSQSPRFGSRCFVRQFVKA